MAETPQLALVEGRADAGHGPRITLVDQAILNAALLLQLPFGIANSDDDMVLTILREELPQMSDHPRLAALREALETALSAYDQKPGLGERWKIAAHIKPALRSALLWRFAGAYDALRASRGLYYDPPATAAE